MWVVDKRYWDRTSESELLQRMNADKASELLKIFGWLTFFFDQKFSS